METENAPTRADTPDALPQFSWKDIFAEGEKRIQKQMVDTMLLTDARDRARLLAQRDLVKKRIKDALEKNEEKKLRAAIREQTKLLATLKKRFTFAQDQTRLIEYI